MTKLQDNLKQLQDYAKNLEKAKRGYVAVGLPKEKVGDKIYGKGMSIVQVGAIHEYGFGNSPTRSFLRIPMQLHADQINDFISEQFAKVFQGESAEKTLGLIGLNARNISVDSFSTDGYGTWESIKQATANAKGSSKTLIDTGTLRNSITYVVRGI
ncbi:hypothetical protein [Pseudoalteromonas sp.]|uniref:hypothetical protein n=1 Tax=Pseudoalteromonas sp. TaxID=53249 RepID=UPI003D0E000E